MGVQTVIYGRILLNKSSEDSVKFIQSLSEYDYYPYIHRDMFSIGNAKQPFLYHQIAVGFSATYKELESNFDSFLAKFEGVLLSLDFDNVKLHMQTEFYGDFEFYWKSKKNHYEVKEKDLLIEQENWYFGFGRRSVWGNLENDEDLVVYESMKLHYPINYNRFAIEQINSLIDKISNVKNGVLIQVNDYLDTSYHNDSRIIPILITMSTSGNIELGQNDKWFWLKKNTELKKIKCK